ncbi:hypothetical protein [Bacillus solimangrovi]|uniref:hypothetical protein n=1 Tax=Bacillus solimangrovi TaxID=1305675 RepID=UPI001586628D|nr:hypothetical protein [Bacillus solimangrovi]
MKQDVTGVKIVLGTERSKKFRSCFVDSAYRILQDRKRSEREQVQAVLEVASTKDDDAS